MKTIKKLVKDGVEYVFPGAVTEEDTTNDTINDNDGEGGNDGENDGVDDET